MKGCYSKGGKIRPKTIHGLRTGQHNNPNVLRAARACGGSVTHKDGERAKRADGGPVEPARGHKVRAPYGNPGKVSADSIKEADRIEADMPRSVGNPNALGLGAGIATAAHFLKNSRMPIPIRGLAAAAGMGVGARSGKALVDDFKDMSSAIDDKIALRDGKVLPGREDRKSGGRVNKANGGPLNAKKRNALPSKDFAGPDRSYPINDANHARNALARASQHASPALKARIQAKVAKKYPGIKQGD